MMHQIRGHPWSPTRWEILDEVPATNPSNGRRKTERQRHTHQHELDRVAERVGPETSHHRVGSTHADRDH